MNFPRYVKFNTENVHQSNAIIRSRLVTNKKSSLAWMWLQMNRGPAGGPWDWFDIFMMAGPDHQAVVSTQSSGRAAEGVAHQSHRSYPKVHF